MRCGTQAKRIKQAVDWVVLQRQQRILTEVVGALHLNALQVSNDEVGELIHGVFLTPENAHQGFSS